MQQKVKYVGHFANFKESRQDWIHYKFNSFLLELDPKIKETSLKHITIKNGIL